MREYRLIRKKKGDLYWAQTRKDKFLFENGDIKLFKYKSAWQRIGRHVDGFGLYDANDYSHGCTWLEALQIIRDYEEQFMDDDPPYVYSYYSQASVRYDIEKKNNPTPHYKN